MVETTMNNLLLLIIPVFRCKCLIDILKSWNQILVFR